MKDEHLTCLYSLGFHLMPRGCYRKVLPDRIVCADLESLNVWSTYFGLVWFATADELELAVIYHSLIPAHRP